MDQKMLLSAIGLGVGVGVGVGIGLALGQTVNKTRGKTSSSLDHITAERMEKEMMWMVVEGKDSQVTFDQFPYYLSEQTRVVLTSAAYVHLKHADVSKYTRNLSPASRAILLSGPAELYQQMLAKALAHHFDTKLLLLDVTDFSLKIQSKYGAGNKEYSFKRSPSESTRGKLSNFLGSLSILEETKAAGTNLRRKSRGLDIASRGIDGSNLLKLCRNASAVDSISSLAQLPPTNPAPLKRTSSWSFDEKLLIQSLYKVLAFISKTGPIVLYLRDVDKLLFKSKRIYSLFHKMLNNLSGSIVILGSRVSDSKSDYGDVSDQLASVFPYNIEIRPPEDENRLVNWKSQLEEDMKVIQVQDNRIHIMEVLSANDLDCDDLKSICVPDTMVLSNYIEEVVMLAISYRLMNNQSPEYRNGKLLISSESLSHGLSIFQEGNASGKDALKLEAQLEKSGDPGTGGETRTVTKSEAPVGDKKGGATETLVSVTKADGDKSSTPTKAPPEAPPDNEFEMRIRPEVIPANEIDVTFADIGALDKIKESLQELVMLPLRRPDLFHGGLLKPCRGILLFGPPGTGKTMMAKAIAREASASFINVSMSTITSKWFGEDEKNVRALFTLAAKVSPTIIFVDEVDSMLGQRSRSGEHEAMRKIKNEFMTHWDGLMTKAGERILVLAATNRPFDLDEAIIRRFERRIMVGLPAMDNREKIMRTLLAKEKVKEGLDYKELATMTEGYSGSDLKNLCATAAYRPVRELLQQEMQRELDEKKAADAKGQESGNDTVAKEVGSDPVKTEVVLRPLMMKDFKQAKEQVAASYATEGASMAELKQWNDLYGEGGSRKKQQLTYFL